MRCLVRFKRWRSKSFISDGPFLDMELNLHTSLYYFGWRHATMQTKERQKTITAAMNNNWQRNLLLFNYNLIIGQLLSELNIIYFCWKVVFTAIKVCNLLGTLAHRPNVSLPFTFLPLRPIFLFLDKGTYVCCSAHKWLAYIVYSFTQILTT